MESAYVERVIPQSHTHKEKLRCLCYPKPKAFKVPLLFLLACLVLISSHVYASIDTEIPVALKDGDLVFRSGSSVWSKIARELSQREKRFSHVGIISVASNRVNVTHAATEGITQTEAVSTVSLEDFCTNSLAVAIYRYDCIPTERALLVQNTQQYLGRPFDFRGNLADSKSIYCTELVWRVYNETFQKMVISTTLVDGKEIVAVDDCYLASGFSIVYDSAHKK